MVFPQILAPAGNRDAFLAAIAAGADAVYCGLKSFSARMQAKNFNLDELAALTDLARARGIDVYVAMNTLVTTDELEPVAAAIHELDRVVGPSALIVQDPALLTLAQQVGFKGQLHVSTLAGGTFPLALETLRRFKQVTRVVTPRELSVDEIKTMAAACPPGIDLEVFVHGALCYAVSGRCYWSSFLGGKSGLRGRCVQPCRRRYAQGKDRGRYFSCMDLSLDVLVKVLAGIPQVRAWKIEGRKKGPHYVYYTVTAYRMLRDEGRDPKAKKAALSLLEQSLGRAGTHYNFLSQRPQEPLQTGVRTASGMMVGKVKGPVKAPYLSPRLALLPGDRLRIGYEDEGGRQTIVIKAGVPAQGRYGVKPGKGQRSLHGMPVFLTDRREKALQAYIQELENALKPVQSAPAGRFAWKLNAVKSASARPVDMVVRRRPASSDGGRQAQPGLWLSPQAVSQLPASQAAHAWWWLPPVIWPDNQAEWIDCIAQACRKGARRFVINSPWQRALLPSAARQTIWAGPFCNLANPAAINLMADLGASGAIVSPELGRPDYLHLPAHCRIPLGVVIGGNWPLCISRTRATWMDLHQGFDSPRGERGWMRQYGQDYWIFPNWRIDLEAHRRTLLQAGYQLMVTMEEIIPKMMRLKQRPGLWNFNLGLS